MMRSRGFTVIELVITIAVMAILLTLGTLGFRSYLSHARDKEREADVMAIQNYLETIYPQEIKDASGKVIKPAGTYPANYSRSSVGEYISQAEVVYIIKDLPLSVRTGPLDGESLVMGQSPFVVAGRSLSTLANVSSITSVTSRTVSSGSTTLRNGAYVYFAHDGQTAGCDKITGCRAYTILYAPENGSWKAAESKRK